MSSSIVSVPFGAASRTRNNRENVGVPARTASEIVSGVFKMEICARSDVAMRSEPVPLETEIIHIFPVQTIDRTNAALAPMSTVRSGPNVPSSSISLAITLGDVAKRGVNVELTVRFDARARRARRRHARTRTYAHRCACGVGGHDPERSPIRIDEHRRERDARHGADGLRPSRSRIDAQDQPLICSEGSYALAFWNQTIDDNGTFAAFSRRIDAREEDRSRCRPRAVHVRQRRRYKRALRPRNNCRGAVACCARRGVVADHVAESQLERRNLHRGDSS